MNLIQTFILGVCIGGCAVFILGWELVNFYRQEVRRWKRHWMKEFDQNVELRRQLHKERSNRDSADYWKDN